jgi:hypothetical protein
VRWVSQVPGCAATWPCGRQLARNHGQQRAFAGAAGPTAATWVPAGICRLTASRPSADCPGAGR